MLIQVAISFEFAKTQFTMLNFEFIRFHINDRLRKSCSPIAYRISQVVTRASRDAQGSSENSGIANPSSPGDEPQWVCLYMQK